MPTIEMAEIASILLPRQKILQTLTPEYLEHKKKCFKSLDHDVAKSGAFTIEDENTTCPFLRSSSSAR